MIHLTLITPKGEKSEVTCLEKQLTGGSLPDNFVVLHGWKVANRHFRLETGKEGLMLYDLGTLSGTRVNGKAYKQYGPIQANDTIEVGGYTLYAQCSDQSQVSSSSSDLSGVNTRVDASRASQTHFSGETQIPLSTQEVSGQAPRPLGPLGPLEEGGMTGATENSLVQCSSALGAPVSSSVSPSVPSFASADNLSAQAQSAQALSAQALSAQAQSAQASPPPASQRPADWNRWRETIHRNLLTQMDLKRLDVSRMSEQELRTTTQTLIQQVLQQLDTLPADYDRTALATEVLNEAIGLGPLETLLADDRVTEIMVNAANEIFVEMDGKLQPSTVTFSNDKAILAIIERIVAPLGRRIDESSPLVDARLADGSRVNAIIPPLAIKGPSITIRKFAKHRLFVEDLVKYGAISEPMVKFLDLAVAQRRSMVVSGGTGSGKTTLLNVLSNFIPTHERIITIEDAAELKLYHPNLVSLEAKPANTEGKGEITIRDLVRNSLRMRPDRIVVGECRGGEALDMLQAMNTGHDGSLTTVHANTPRDALSRIEVMVLMAGVEMPMAAIREQIASGVHLIVQQTRFACGSRKVTRISEITGIESGTIQVQDIFLYQQNGYGADGRVQGRFMATGAIPEFYEALSKRGIEVDLSIFRNPEGGK
jgi:pilus assembly protein CpaF